jgi:hypothetical protein
MTTTNQGQRMTVIRYANSYHLRSKDGNVHSTRYATKDLAALAAKRISLGLLHFIPLSTQIKTMDTTNHA